MLALLVLAPLALSSPVTQAPDTEGRDTAFTIGTVELRPDGRNGQDRRPGAGVNRTYERLFAPAQPSAKGPAPAPDNPGPEHDVICGMVVMTAPEVDPGIRIPVPRPDLKFAIRTVPPLACHKDK
jgi:hypothetical protein